MLVTSCFFKKGGVGKTTTTVNLAAALVRAGKSVLMIDADQNHGLTSYFQGVTDILDRPTMIDLMVNKQPIEPIKLGKRIHLLPSDMQLDAVDRVLANAMRREYILDRMLKEHYRDYDHILIDCPPGMGLMNINAVAASQWLVIPVQVELLSLNAVSDMFETIKEVKETGTNPDIRVWRILPTMRNAAIKQHGEVVETLAENKRIGSMVYQEAVKRKAAYTYAVSEHVDIAALDSKEGEYWDKLASQFIQDVEGSK